MDKVKTCIDRIRAVMGVSNGVITDKQLESIFDLYCAEESDKKRVYEYLEDNRILPETEEKADEAEIMDVRRRAFVEKFTRETRVVLLSEDTRKRRFEEMLGECTEAIRSDPALATRYYEEFGLMKKYIKDTEFHEKWLPSRCLIMTLFHISLYRAREQRKYGWACGSNFNRVKERFEVMIRHLFSEDELAGIIDVCLYDGDLNERQAQVLALLLHKVPKPRINRNFGIDDLL